MGGGYGGGVGSGAGAALTPGVAIMIYLGACAACVCLQLWLGGSPNQTRLAKVFVERMKVRDLEATLEPLFAAFKARRQTPVSWVAAWSCAPSGGSHERLAFWLVLSPASRIS